ncbi:DUF4829 domain-containing protein [Bacillus sp. FJAT-27225]|nr:DUF4829 domain-containing protein [Bacillus sp. FJAT-27225]
MVRIVFFLCSIVSIFFLMSFISAGKTNNVVVSVDASSKFSEEEVYEAIAKVKKKFKVFKGCELTELWYSEESSNQAIEAYLNHGRGSENGVKSGNVIVLLSTFKVDSSGGDGSFEPNSTQSDWQWILIRNSKTGDWRVDGWGY